MTPAYECEWCGGLASYACGRHCDHPAFVQSHLCRKAEPTDLGGIVFTYHRTLVVCPCGARAWGNDTGDALARLEAA